MAANCGLDFRAEAEFVGCITARELHLIRQPAIKHAQRLMHLFNLRRALPVVEGLLAGLDSSKAVPEQAAPAACETSREAAKNAAEVGSIAPFGLGSGLIEGGQCASCSQCDSPSDAKSALEERSKVDCKFWSVPEFLQCYSRDDFLHRLRSLVSSMHNCFCMQTDVPG